MSTAEQHNDFDRRRVDHTITELEHSLAAQNQVVTKLLVVTENTATAMQQMESWREAHERDYRAVRERLLSQEITGSNISQRLDKVTAAFEMVSASYMNDKHRMLGAYAAIGSAGAIVLGLIAVAKAFGLL